MAVGAQKSMCQKVRSVRAASSRRGMLTRVSTIQLQAAAAMAIRFRITGVCRCQPKIAPNEP
jgi:hypothetical protein